MNNFLDSLIDKNNKEADPEKVYLHPMDFLKPIKGSKHIPLVEPVWVTNVIKEENNSYTFSLIGVPEIRYRSNYGWAFILNTPENLKLYYEVCALRKEKELLEARIQAALDKVSKL